MHISGQCGSSGAVIPTLPAPQTLQGDTGLVAVEVVGPGIGLDEGGWLGCLGFDQSGLGGWGCGGGLGALPGEGEREAEEEHAGQDQPGGDAQLACLFHRDSPLLKRSENFYQLMMGQVRYAVGYQRGCFRIRQLVPNMAGIKKGRGQEMDINYYRN